MMEKIRTVANNIVIKIIFGIIIIAFIFTGVGSFLGMSETSANDEQLYIAKVNGEGISRADFEQQVKAALSNKILWDNSEFSTRLVRQQIFSSNVENHLKYKLSHDLNLTISDEKLKQIIRQQNVFYVNGAFNNERYLTLLQQNGYTPDVYAELLRADAQKQQLTSALLFSDFSLPVESELSQLINQKREGYYTNVYANSIVDKSEIEVTEEEAQQYYEDNQQQFILGNRIKIKLLVNAYGDAMKKAKMPTEEECKNQYKNNKTAYTESAKYEFILIEADNEATANKLDSMIQDEKNLLQIDPQKIINLGWFKQSVIPDYLGNTLTKKGQTQVKLINENYYVVLLNDIQKEKVLPFEYVYPKIKQALFTERAQVIYDEKNGQLLKASKDYDTLEDIAKVTELELYEPENWQEKAKADTLYLLSYPELRDLVFDDEFIHNSIESSKISQLIEINDPKSTYLVQILDFKPEGLAPFDEVHNKIVNTIIDNKAKEVFVDTVELIIASLNETGSDPRISLSTKYQLTRDSEEFNDSTKTMIYSLIQPATTSKRAFGADHLKPDMAMIAVLTKVENGEISDITEKLKKINMKVIYSGFSADLISKAKIEFMPNANL